MSAYPKAIDPKDQDEVEHDFRAALGFSYWTPGEKHECVRTEIGSGAYTLGCSYCQQPWPCPTVHEASLIEGTGVK